MKFLKKIFVFIILAVLMPATLSYATAVTPSTKTNIE